MRLIAFLLVSTALVGCVDPDANGAVADLIGTPIVIDHDHNDHSLHTASHGIDFVSWSSLDVTLGDNGYANFVFWADEEAGEDLAFVAIDGDDEGGFVIADVSNPRDVRVLSKTFIDGNSFQEVRVTPDGRYAVLNVQDIPEAGRLTSPDGAADCSICLHFWDISDRTSPRHAGAVPVELLGSHNMDFWQYDDGLYLFYVGQPLYFGSEARNPFPGNHVNVARVVESAGQISLVDVAELRLPEAYLDTERSFPHDVLVQQHPDGRLLAYVSHWQGGAVVFDVSNLAGSTIGPISVVDDPAPSEVSNIHWVMQEPRARADGRVIAWSAPEIGALESGSGVIRAYDVTDPGAMRQLGTWALPGEVTIPDRFIFSGHTTVPDMDRGLLAVAHYHAGVWILDITDPFTPTATAFYLPHGDPDTPYDGPIWWKKPNFSPDGYGPNVYQARWKDDLLWVTDRGTGFYVLDYTGAVPGPL